MNEEFNEEDNIDFFNTNFECDDEKQIMDLYKIEKSIQNNDNISKKIQIEKYNHPLFLNYNYCLFCLERRKTKYNQNNLDSIHNKVSMKTIGEFLEKNQINLKIPKNKNEKLSKRRFIHSYEINHKNNTENNDYYDSDTELYIQKNNEDNPYAKSTSKKFRMTMKRKSKNLNNIKKSSKLFSPNIEIGQIFNEDDNILNRNFTKKNEIKKKNINLIKTYNEILNKPVYKKNTLTHSTSKSKQEEGENTILSLDKKKANLNNKKKEKTFFGFITNYFYDNNENERNNLSVIEQINETEDISLQYFEKNEKCGICLDEIKDKFTLFCGDFFCRECIIKLLEESINNISSFDKIECPRCHDIINESTIKFLLNRQYLEKYNKMKTRIEGLKNNKNVPCPFPDCEGFAPKEEAINGTLQCQNNHIFCNKCFEIIPPKYRLERKNLHTCIQKYPENEKYLSNNKNIRKCPQCNSWVQREPGGCNYFRCSNIWCKYEFCWICGRKYEPSHYRNPLSMCFGLVSSDIQGKMIKSLKARRLRCILIALLVILILFPIICIFFSFFLIFSFVMYFHFDGKELRNVRFHSKLAHKIFYMFYAVFIVCISIGLIPFGYICLVLLILAIPILIIVNKIKNIKGNDF